jgi:iron(III) transport system permease protein
LLSFVLAVEQFAIPAMIGIPAHFNMLATELYTLVMFQPPQQGAAAALGLLLAAITSVALFAHYQIARRTSAVTVTGRSFRRVVHALGWMKMPATIFCFTPVLAATAIPIAALSYAAFTKYPVSNPFEASYTFRAVTALFTSGGTVDILWNTLLACTSATALAAFLGFVIAFQVQRKNRSSARMLQSFGAMSFGFPGIVIGLGFLWSYIYLPIYGTLFALILAFSARYLPYAVETTSAALRQLDVGLEEAADMAGASALYKIRRIVLPLLRPSLQSASLLLFVTFVREISAAALLYTPDTQVLSIAIWTSFEHANWARASVLSLIVVAIVLAITAAASMNEGGRHAQSRAIGSAT